MTDREKLKEKLLVLLVAAQDEAERICDAKPCIECVAHEYACCDAALTVDALIREGVAVQQWIPASDSPKERGEYTVLEKHWVDGHLEVRKGRWNGMEWFLDGHESRLVAYWLPNLPLPELPKEGE